MNLKNLARTARAAGLRAGGILAVFLSLGIAAAAEAQAASNVLIWQDNSTNELRFNIERKIEPCTGGLPFGEIAQVGPNVTTYTDSAVTEGLTYCYRVAASNSAGRSAFSNTAQRLVPPTVPVAPTNLGVAGGP